MKKFYKIVLIIPVVIFSNNILEKNKLSKHLKGLEPFIGKTFKGKFINSTPDIPNFDTNHWERVLNGNAVRITHSVNDGEFGGERIIIWDPDQESLVSWYFTTAGIITNSIIRIEKNRLVSIEDVSKNDNGIKKIKTIYTLTNDGHLSNKIKYFMNNIWVDAHELVYYKDINAKVIFK